MKPLNYELHCSELQPLVTGALGDDMKPFVYLYGVAVTLAVQDQRHQIRTLHVVYAYIRHWRSDTTNQVSLRMQRMIESAVDSVRQGYMATTRGLNP